MNSNGRQGNVIKVHPHTPVINNASPSNIAFTASIQPLCETPAPIIGPRLHNKYNIIGVIAEMEEEFQHIHHQGFTEHRKLSARQKWLAFGLFAVAAFFYTFAPFTLSVPILTFMLRWYPRPVILYINWAVGNWLTITIVSAYCLLP